MLPDGAAPRSNAGPASRDAAAGRPAHRLVAAATAFAALTALTACGAGQHAQTAEERPTLDGTYATQDDLSIGGVSLLTPPSGVKWSAGSTVPMTLYVANSSNKPDKLLDVTSPQFGGWSVVPASSVQAGAGTSSGTSTPSSASPAPSPSMSNSASGTLPSSTAGSSVGSSSASAGSSQPQPIPAFGALSFSLTIGYQASAGTSSGRKADQALVLTGLKTTLYPASVAKVTLTFARAGKVSLQVPVQLTATPGSQSVSGTNSSGVAGTD